MQALMITLLLMSLTTHSAANETQCVKAYPLSTGGVASCNGVLVGVEQLRLAVLCKKETVPKLTAELNLCTKTLDLERKLFDANLKAAIAESAVLKDRLESANSVINKVVWSAAGFALGAVLATLAK